ncbi:MAG: HlyD family type I secretion periplasmic adaptor subunit [Deltaproteobacteria bacterium]|nr:HlyD family type I secretion periplasmic adaptor subunit [Deltaproteobacteria bacterium]
MLFGKQNDHHEFKPLLVEIEEEPLNPLGRTVFWIIITAMLFFSLWLFFGKIDVVVTARGKVIPTGEIKTVQPLSTGVVRNILVRPGDFVEKGAVLMEIDPSDIDPELESMEKDLKQVELELLRLEALLNDTAFDPPAYKFDADLLLVQGQIYQSSREKLFKQVIVKNKELRQLGERLASQRKVHQRAAFQHHQTDERFQRLQEVRDIISRDAFEQGESDLKAAESEMKTSAHGIGELESNIQRVNKEIDLIREEERNRLLTELAEKQQRRSYLAGKVQRSSFLSSRQLITSPVKGHVAQLLFHTIGGVVTPAEALATIVPLDSPLLIKAFVENKDVGYLTPGMDVSLKVDTFEFQKYGILEGELLQVSKDSIEDERMGLVYETYVKPLQTTLMVDGKETAISTGMSISAEIKVGKRRIIEFFIYPLIKYWNEGISVR